MRTAADEKGVMFLCKKPHATLQMYNIYISSASFMTNIC